MGCARTTVTLAHTTTAVATAAATRLYGTAIAGSSSANSGSSHMRACMKSPPTRRTYRMCANAQPAASRTIANRRPPVPRSSHPANAAAPSTGDHSQ